MNKEQKDILVNNAKEYLSSGSDELLKKRYNSAVVLFFKSLVSLADIFILDNLGKIPSSHNNRFRILKENFPDIYDIIDKDFPFYQDSYIYLISKELVEVVKNDTEIMAKKAKVEL